MAMKMRLALALVAGLSSMVAVAEVKPLVGQWLASGETLVCFGDSITASKSGYVSILTDDLAKKGIKVVNAGLSGDKTPMALTRVKDIAELKPDAVMIFFGANDSLIGRGRWRDEPKVDPVTFRDNLKWIIHYLRMKAGVKKFSIVAPTGQCEGAGIGEFGQVSAAYRLAAREAADDMNAVLVPLDYAFETALKAGRPDEKGLLLTVDGLHFNAEGKKLAASCMLSTWNMK